MTALRPDSSVHDGNRPVVITERRPQFFAVMRLVYNLNPVVRQHRTDPAPVSPCSRAHKSMRYGIIPHLRRREAVFRQRGRNIADGHLAACVCCHCAATPGFTRPACVVLFIKIRFDDRQYDHLYLSARIDSIRFIILLDFIRRDKAGRAVSVFLLAVVNRRSLSLATVSGR